MSYIATILLTGATMLVSAFGIYNYMPLSWLEIQSENNRLGSGSLQTISGTDQVKNFPDIYNANNTFFADTKVNVASTTWPQLTTATGLTSVGTLVSGALGSGFTAVNVAQGGTGSTTLASNLVLLGNGTSLMKTVNGPGASGQFLTSNGAGSAPSWQSASVDQSQTYLWTGRHSFTSHFGVGTTTPTVGTAGIQGNLAVSATGYFSSLVATGTIKFNGVTLQWPGALPSASSTLGVNSSGQVSFLPGHTYYAASTTQRLVTDDTAENIFAGVHIPAGTLGTTGIIRVTIVAIDSGSANDYFRVKFGGTTFASFSIATEGSSGYARAVVDIANRNDAAAQIGYHAVTLSATSTGAAFSDQSVRTGTINTALAQQLQIYCQKETAGANCGSEMLYIEILK